MEYKRLPNVDVLILGTGLAGLSAASAALEATPRPSVALVSNRQGASGSSFTNRNNRLGIHVPWDDAGRDTFLREAASLASPGEACEALLTVLATDARARVHELETLGVPFLKDEAGAYQRHASCFSPHTRNAVVFEPLEPVYDRMARQVVSSGATIHAPLDVLALLQTAQGERVLGALLAGPEGELSVLPANAVVMALGGAAGLYAHSQAGAGVSGVGHGLLAQAGARMRNTRYMQWMWASRTHRRFWPIWDLVHGRATRLDHAGAPIALPDAIREQSRNRAEHCPIGFGLPDACLDELLLEDVYKNGVAKVMTATGERLEVLPMAHASNGGAMIDVNARTSVPGLFAAGECATGMHGANRIGGGMVAACLVFGALAGRTAAVETDAASESALNSAIARAVAAYSIDHKERHATAHWLAGQLQTHTLPFSQGHGACPSDLRSHLNTRLRHTRDTTARLCLTAALLMTE